MWNKEDATKGKIKIKYLCTKQHSVNTLEKIILTTKYV